MAASVLSSTFIICTKYKNVTHTVFTVYLTQIQSFRSDALIIYIYVTSIQMSQPAQMQIQLQFSLNTVKPSQVNIHLHTMLGRRLSIPHMTTPCCLTPSHIWNLECLVSWLVSVTRNSQNNPSLTKTKTKKNNSNNLHVRPILYI